jgi:maleate isomerase
MDNYQIARRAQIGVIIPSTNTGVEYDLQKFHLEGVTWHPSRFWIELRNWADEVESSGDDSDTVFERFLEIMRGEIPVSLRNVISAKVNHIMLGMSAETFWGGKEGSIQFEEGIREHIGDLGLTTGATATKEALDCFGAKTLSVITPYPKVGDENVRQYFEEIGYEVEHVCGLARP